MKRHLNKRKGTIKVGSVVLCLIYMALEKVLCAIN